MKVCVKSGGKTDDFTVAYAPVSWEGWLLAQPWRLCIKAKQSHFVLDHRRGDS